MLPLEINDLASEEDWHCLKTALVICRLGAAGDARTAYDELPSHLKAHRIGRAVAQYVETRDMALLDSVAVDLTQRTLPDAWTLLERL